MRIRMLGGAVALAALAYANTGCISLSVMQEARTLPPGKHQIGFGLGTGLLMGCEEQMTYSYDPNTGSYDWRSEWKPYALYGMDEQVFYRAGIASMMDFGIMYAPPATLRVDVKFMFLDAEHFAGSIALGGRFMGSGSQSGGGSTRFYQGEFDTPLIFTADLGRHFAITFGAKNIAVFRSGTSEVTWASGSQTYKYSEFNDLVGAFFIPTIRATRRFAILLEFGAYKAIVLDTNTSDSANPANNGSHSCNPNDLSPIFVFNLGFVWTLGRAEVD